MDYAYSPHRETGGTMHLPSPTHPHSYHMDGFSSIQQLRRSLSRSPSKPSRFQLRTTRAQGDTPRSPISPLALSRAFSPKPAKDASPTSTYPVSPLAAQAPTTTTTTTTTATKKKFSLRRTAPFRSSPRTRNASKSPRRVLADSVNQGNATPFTSRWNSGEENISVRKSGAEPQERFSMDQKPNTMRFDINDNPIKFEFARSRVESNAPGANCLQAPVKSSPLKRSDGIMNLDTAGSGSPVPKRRSLHGASAFGADFDIFDHGPTPRSSLEDTQRHSDTEMTNSYSFSSPISKTNSPLRKTSSLRKSTLSQRHASNAPRTKQDHEFAVPTQAASKARNRMSLDSSLAFSSGTTQSPFRRSTHFESVRSNSHQAVPSLRGGAGPSQPHPLSHALTPSSSSSSVVEDTPTHAPPAAPTAAPRNHVFARSLPIGATRPHEPQSQSSESSFETPAAYKMAKPLPAAFMSTGLISKRNRNIDEPPAGTFESYAMPDTPSKRMSFPPVTGTPTFSRSIFRKPSQPKHEFGTPSTPFSVHASKAAPETFGKGVNIFGSFNSGLQRRGSFASIDGEDLSNSPTGNHVTDSQSSNDEMPPTPTKQHDGSGRRSKENSLRSSLFGRRTSLTSNTFAPPDATETPSIAIPSPTAELDVSPVGDRKSPHTPSESFVPPDPSKLSISGHASRRGSIPFNSSTNSNMSFPPATPTAPRDHTIFFGNGQPSIAPIVGLTKNDVDTSLTSRFHSVQVWGNGEFSQVYRVAQPVSETPRQRLVTTPTERVWAVKKAKHPYTGMHDRKKKLREVDILRALRGHEHVVSLTDSWEHRNHLYIQTDFCENGNLKDFLAQTGYKSRLDDFRIWKILLELSLGVKHIHDMGFIHLDLKPANILIDWEGVLKIGDFGMASTWPAPAGIDGEGDRNYIGPEVLCGRFDRPADVFALGAIMCEIAGNLVLPENGTSWQRLRSGDFTEVPSLTWSSESSLNRTASGEPIDTQDVNSSNETLCISDTEDILSSMASMSRQAQELIKAPSFMIDRDDRDAMDNMVQWMMNPNPDQRPVIGQVYHCGGVQWVEKRRRAGATVYEGNWGPADDVLGMQHDADMMDTS